MIGAIALIAALSALVLPAFGRPASAALSGSALPSTDVPTGSAPDVVPPVEPAPAIPAALLIDIPAASPNPAPSESVPPAESALPNESAELPAAPPPAAPAPLLDLPSGEGAAVRVPIVMYHHIGGLPAAADPLRIGLTLSADDFAAQLAFLRDNGYQTVSLNDVVAAIYGEKVLPERPIVLSFDDGYLDHYTDAFPLLQEYGLTGTFFIVTSLVGDDEYVTWDQLREMAAAGMRIEAHGLTHRDLRYLGADGIRHEAVEARKTLEDEIGQPVRFYCYPSGKYTDETPPILAEAGYLGAVTVQYGLTSHPAGRFEMPRVRVNHGVGSSAFAQAVGSGQ